MPHSAARATPFTPHQEVTDRLAADLVARGYVLCDNVGQAIGPDRKPVNCVGLLFADRTTPARRALWRPFRHRARRVRLGTIWTNSGIRDAAPDYWVFEVIGREHYEHALRLIRDLETAFNVRSHVKISQNEIEGETISRDLDNC